MEKPSPEILVSALKQGGLRLTPQRIAICNLLAGTDAHPTAAMIFEDIRRFYPSLSLTTVYNTLDVLVEAGVINVLGHAGDNTVHYDANTNPHVNLACISCHTIVDIESPQMAHIHREINAASGYKLLGARVMYYGLCPTCQLSPS
jgi:Fur family peroxide stress response transcriptional regulator